MSDRTVHGLTATGSEIVRYDRTGKWYVESQTARRKHIPVAEAARLAYAGTHHEGRPGGSALDRVVRALTGEED